MKFKLPLTETELSELCLQLMPLTTDITYESGTLHIEPVQKAKPEDNRETEAEITDIVIPYIQIVNELPDWGELARQAAKTKRLATKRERVELTALKAKRRLQAGAR